MSDDRDTIYRMQREMAVMRQVILLLAKKLELVEEWQDYSDLAEKVVDTQS